MTRRLKYLLPPIIWLTAQTALAAGIQVSQARLDFTVAANRQSSQTLTVINPTADVQLFEVYPDDFTEAIKTNPASFTLEAGAKKTVTIAINLQGLGSQTTGQIVSTNLSVVDKPLSGSQQFSVGTGVKIPISIIQTDQAGNWENKFISYRWILPALGLLLLVALGMLASKIRQKNKGSSEQAPRY